MCGQYTSNIAPESFLPLHLENIILEKEASWEEKHAKQERDSICAAANSCIGKLLIKT